LLLAKFIAGSNWASLLAGQAGISATRFVIYDSIGSLTWSGGYIALGYLLHGQLHWTLAQTLRPLFIVRVALSLARLWRRRSLAHTVLALAIVFFAARPVSQHNAGMRMSADAWQNVRPPHAIAAMKQFSALLCSTYVPDGHVEVKGSVQ
jgi:hypothetical protein